MSTLVRALIAVAAAVVLVVAINLVGNLVIPDHQEPGTEPQQMAEQEAAAPTEGEAAAPAGEAQPMEQAAEETAGEAEQPAEEMAAEEKPAAEEPQQAAAGDAPEASSMPSGDAAAGETVTNKCKACHTFEQGGANKVGPNLFGVLDRNAGSAEGFRYSKDFQQAAGAIGSWEPDEVFVYLEDPTGYLRQVTGNSSARSKMTFKLKSEQERADVIAYLKTLK